MTNVNPDGVQGRDQIAGARSPARWLAFGSVFLIPVSVGAAFMAQTSMLMVGGVAGFFALMAFVGARSPTVHGKITVAICLVGQAICLTAALSGHPWQIDSHMMFFAILAVCMIMAEPVVILAAAAAIAVHHLVLSLAMPALVYPSFDLFENLQRTAVHGIIVVVEAAFLWVALRERNRAMAESVAKGREAMAAAEQTREALASAEAARSEAEAALESAKNAQQDAQNARLKAEAGTADAIEADRKAREAEESARKKRAQIEADQQKVVDTLREALKTLAAGDLSLEIKEPLPQTYEDLRLDYNTAVVELRAAIADFQVNAGGIINDVVSIEDAAGSLAQRTESQAATLEETSAAVSQIANNSRNAAENAGQADRIVEAARARATSSDEIVKQAIAAMAEIEDSSGRISKIVDVIEDIAFQTNLLALNAGVEAVRAGDKGRGFSVVASEVRELAQRSSEAAREIGGLIENSSRQVTTGVDLVSDTGNAIGEINGAIAEISALVSAVKSAADEQSLSISETNQAMVQLEGVTQQNAAMFEETNAVTQSLAEQARYLRTVLDRFETGGNCEMGQKTVTLDVAPKGALTPRAAGVAKSVPGNLAVAQVNTDLDPGWEEF